MADHAADIVTYVVVPPSTVSSADHVVAELDGASVRSAAIRLCRELPADVRPSALPPAPSSADRPDDTSIIETWTTDTRWLGCALDDGLDGALANRLIVRVPWPPSAEDEMVLLGARLACPTLTVAVVIDVEHAAEIFHYFNRFGFPWFALPREATWRAGWPAALQMVARRWCLDGGVRTPMEPVASAFGRAVARRLNRVIRPWRLRVVAPGTESIVPWSPSVHALLLGDSLRAVRFPLHALAESDCAWEAALDGVCEQLDPDGLSDWLAGAGALQSAEACDDA